MLNDVGMLLVCGIFKSALTGSCVPENLCGQANRPKQKSFTSTDPFQYLVYAEKSEDKGDAPLLSF
jgi:hypothetical protein